MLFSQNIKSNSNNVTKSIYENGQSSKH